jgi:hypothetical protein
MILPYIKTSRKLATTSAFASVSIIAWFKGTGTSAALSSQQGVDDSSRTADTGLYRNGTNRAIAAARSAFHAGIAILDCCMFAIHFKHFMGTDFQAHPAAGAFIFVEL